MTWILFALLAPLFWAITNILDKYLLEKHIPNPFVYLFLTGATSLLVLLGIVFWGFQVPTLPVMLACLGAGALFNYQMLPYFKALQITEASRVIPLYQFTPVFALLFAYIFLHETISAKALAAFALLVVGGFLIALERAEGVFRISRALFFMLGACALYALYLILSRYVYLHVSYFTGLTWESIGGFVSVVPLLLAKSTRKGIRDVFVKMTNGAKSLLFVNETFNILAIVFVQLALVAGPASLVGALGGIQPLYVLVLTALISTFLPAILKEDTALKTLLHKAFAIVLLIAGVVIVSA